MTAMLRHSILLFAVMQSLLISWSEGLIPNSQTKQTGCNHSKLDLVIVLDSSGSVGSPNFARTRNFTNQVISNMNVSPDDVRVAVVRYSSRAEVITPLNGHMDKASKMEVVQKMAFKPGSTLTGRALEMVSQTVLTPENGDRPDVKDFVILTTDGAAVDPNRVKQYASELKERKDLLMMAIAIGNQVKSTDLSAIASGPSFIYRVDFANLWQVVKNVSTVTCPEPLTTDLIDDINTTTLPFEAITTTTAMPDTTPAISSTTTATTTTTEETITTTTEEETITTTTEEETITTTTEEETIITTTIDETTPPPTTTTIEETPPLQTRTATATTTLRPLQQPPTTTTPSKRTTTTALTPLNTTSSEKTTKINRNSTLSFQANTTTTTTTSEAEREKTRPSTAVLSTKMSDTTTDVKPSTSAAVAMATIATNPPSTSTESSSAMTTEMTTQEATSSVTSHESSSASFSTIALRSTAGVPLTEATVPATYPSSSSILVSSSSFSWSSPASSSSSSPSSSSSVTEDLGGKSTKANDKLRSAKSHQRGGNEDEEDLETIGLAVGLGALGVILLSVATVCLVLGLRRRRSDDDEDGDSYDVKNP